MPNERHSTQSARRRKSKSGNSQTAQDGQSPLAELPNIQGLTIQYNPPVYLSRNHLYPRKALEIILGVSDHTIKAWVEQGLEPMPGKGKQFFCGEEVVEFLKRLRDSSPQKKGTSK